MNTSQFLIVHHEAPPQITDLPRFGIVNEYHKSKDFPKSKRGYWCGYHYFIEKSGQIWQARNDDEIGAHTIGYNDKSIGICLAGNFNLEKPSYAQINALQGLLQEKVDVYHISPENIVPHRKLAVTGTLCYGSNLTNDWARSVLKDVQKIKILRALVGAYQKLIMLLRT